MYDDVKCVSIHMKNTEKIASFIYYSCDAVKMTNARVRNDDFPYNC